VRPDDRRGDAVVAIILGGLSAFGPLSTDLYLPGLPALTQDLGASVSAGQLTLTACLFGIAAGQLLVGPVSDSLGRRGPLLAGLVGYVATSAGCALAPSIGALITLRFLQGFAGGVGVVIATAIVRDLYSGNAAARIFARRLLVTGVAPIVAPLIGGQLLRLTSWRGLFVFLVGIGLVLLLVGMLGVGETLPPERRRRGGLGDALRTFARLARERAFVAHGLIFSLAFAAGFAYIAASPFVLENIYGVSAQLFGVLFALNVASFIAVAQVSVRAVERFGPARLLRVGVVAAAVAGLWVLAVVAAHGGLALLLPGLFVVFAANGLVVPNAMALALAEQQQSAGSASALLGLGQFGFAALVAPLVGVAGSASALPMGLMIAALTVAALAVSIAAAGRPYLNAT
jgi:DHA1 family bicyclomycin/chloramphenicol resistance-like MFS transporter